METKDKSYEACMAHDIFAMIQEAREQGMDLEGGFHCPAFDNKSMRFGYIFCSRKSAMERLAPPPGLREKLMPYNVFASVDIDGKLESLFLVCGLATPFAQVATEQEVEACLKLDGLQEYEAKVKAVLTADVEATMVKGSKTTQ